MQEEQTRVDVLNWLRRRWAGVRQEGGFDVPERWVIKKISHGEFTDASLGGDVLSACG
jgi:hypothetical protein